MIFVASVASAGPIGIQVVSARHTTTLDTTVDFFTDPLNTVVTHQSASPLHDALTVASRHYPGGVSTEADADLFGIRVFAVHGQDARSSVSALTEMEFAPLEDVTTTLGLAFTAIAQSHWSEGTMSLFDKTANQSIWSYEWACCGFSQSTVPWIRQLDGPYTFTATVDALTAFSADHLYGLTMSLRTFGQEAEEHNLTMQVSGLHVVPEPSSLLLFTSGLLAVWAHRRKEWRG